MFTVGALMLGSLLAWFAGRKNESDRSAYDAINGETQDRLLLLHIRQDIKLIAFLLFGILVVLGVIADRLS